MASTPAAELKADLAFLCRALQGPSLAGPYPRLAERARAVGWSFVDYLAACLEGEVSARQDHGGEIRIRAARLPARKTLEEFDYAFQRPHKRDRVLHLATRERTSPSLTR